MGRGAQKAPRRLPCCGLLDAQRRREVGAVGERSDEVAVEVGGGLVGVHEDGAVVDVRARAPDHAAVVRVFEVGVAGAGDGVAVVVGFEDERDGSVLVLAGSDELLVEVRGRAVGFDADDAVAGGCEVVVGRQFQRGRVFGGDVFVAGRPHEFFHALGLRVAALVYGAPRPVFK